MFVTAKSHYIKKKIIISCSRTGLFWTHANLLIEEAVSTINSLDPSQKMAICIRIVSQNKGMSLETEKGKKTSDMWKLWVAFFFIISKTRFMRVSISAWFSRSWKLDQTNWRPTASCVNVFLLEGRKWDDVSHDSIWKWNFVFLFASTLKHTVFHFTLSC